MPMSDRLGPEPGKRKLKGQPRKGPPLSVILAAIAEREKRVADEAASARFHEHWYAIDRARRRRRRGKHGEPRR